MMKATVLPIQEIYTVCFYMRVLGKLGLLNNVTIERWLRDSNYYVLEVHT